MFILGMGVFNKALLLKETKRKTFGCIAQFWSKAMPTYITHFTSKAHTQSRTPSYFVSLTTIEKKTEVNV